MTCGGPQDLARRDGHGVRLQDQVHTFWPTVVVGDSRSAARHTTTTDAMHPGTMLLDAVRQWPTPDTVNRKSERAMTPSMNNGKRNGSGQSSGPGLEQAAQLATGEVPHDVPNLMPPHVAKYLNVDFPTPSATEYGSSQNGINGRGGEHERPSAGTPSLSTAARKGALPGGTRGVLNPIFVEALMGWPLGWTEPSSRACGFVPFPPGPQDTDGWAAYLASFPDAAPAVSNKAEVAHRVDRLRACGNGVVPQQAEAAITELLDALGVGRDPESQSRAVLVTGPFKPRGWRNRWRDVRTDG